MNYTKYHTHITHILIMNGVLENEVDCCMRWAFGDDVDQTLLSELDDRWRTIHPDLFVIRGTDNVDESLVLVAKEYLKKRKI